MGGSNAASQLQDGLLPEVPRARPLAVFFFSSSEPIPIALALGHFFYSPHHQVDDKNHFRDPHAHLIHSRTQSPCSSSNLTPHPSRASRHSIWSLPNSTIVLRSSSSSSSSSSTAVVIMLCWLARHDCSSSVGPVPSSLSTRPAGRGSNRTKRLTNTTAPAGPNQASNAKANMRHFVTKGRTTCSCYIGRHSHILSTTWLAVASLTAHLKMSMLPSTVYLRQNVHVTSLLLTFGCDSSSLPMLLNDFTSPANGPEPRSSRTINKLYASAVHR